MQGKLTPDIMKQLPSQLGTVAGGAGLVLQLEGIYEDNVAMLYTLQKENSPVRFAIVRDVRNH